jgi:hypothetical protein
MCDGRHEQWLVVQILSMASLKVMKIGYTPRKSMRSFKLPGT